MDGRQKGAFPRDLYHQQGWRPIQRGMNMLEYYAGQALIGLLAFGHTVDVEAMAWEKAEAMCTQYPYNKG